VSKELEKYICNLWWGSSTHRRKIHWIKWQNICNHKKKIGMGFRNPRALNEALLAKQGWRLITHPKSLVAQILKAKYYPKEHFMKATAKHNMIYTLRSIMHASCVLKNGCLWTIGNGDNIDLWEDNWIHKRGNASTWSSKPDSTNYQKVKDILVENGTG
jgi:hypothetical protein